MREPTTAPVPLKQFWRPPFASGHDSAERPVETNEYSLVCVSSTPTSVVKGAKYTAGAPRADLAKDPM